MTTDWVMPVLGGLITSVLLGVLAAAGLLALRWLFRGPRG